MIIYNITDEEIRQALDLTNEVFNNNICFKEGTPYYLTKHQKTHKVLLTVKSSKDKGHKIGFMKTSLGNNRRLAHACWHVFGCFFDNILKVQSNAIIKINSFGENRKIYKDGGSVIGNWEDFERISANWFNDYNAVMESNLCEC